MKLNFRDLTVRNKILFGYFLILILFICLGVYYINATKQISAASRRIELRNFIGVELVTEIERNILLIKNLHRGVYFAQNDQQLARITNQLDIYLSKATQLLYELNDLVRNEPDNKERLSKIISLYKDYAEIVHKDEGLKSWEKTGRFHESLELRQLEEELADLRNEDISSFSLALGSIDRLAKAMLQSYVSVLLILIVVSVLIAYFISNIIIKPIMDLVTKMRKLGTGNLEYNIEVKSNDEIGTLQTGFMLMASRLKQAYDELRSEKDGLEASVKERTKDLEKSHNYLIEINEELKKTQAQLIQSTKMAAVGLLAGGVAHEINNPLTGVLNNVQLIKFELEARKNLNASEFKELLNIVEESALRCKQIIKALLEFSRMDKGEFAPTMINEVLEKVIFLVANELKREKIKVIKEFADNLPLVNLEKNRFQQVILDIINNSRWALKNKKNARLIIRTFLLKETNLLLIEIHDNGVGIDKQNLGRVFEPFFTTKEVGEGTGLGLSICYQIIDEHRGTIEAESEGRRKGATFRIKLPVFNSLNL